MPTTVPMTVDQSVLGWEIESTFKTAAAAAAYRPFGRVNEWQDLGPQFAVFRDHVAGNGREASAVGFEGRTYTGTIGPFQVVNPLVLGMAWGEEASGPTQIGATSYYRHTVTPTTNGRLPSMSVQMLDKQGAAQSSPVTDKTTYLGTIVNRLAVRGERVNDDGSGGRVTAGLEVMAHDSDTSVAAKTVTADSSEPYRYSHGAITLLGEQVYRVLEWEFTLDNRATYAYYHQDSTSDKPYEASPGDVQYGFSATIVADGEKFSANGGTDETLHEAFVAKRKANATISMTRTTDQDEWDINLTDLVLASAPKVRTRNGDPKVEYRVTGFARASTFTYVDTSSSAFFPT